MDNNNPQWGGCREGAGRKATGRRRANFYITEDEEVLLKKYLEAIRECEKWIPQQELLDEYDKRMNTAVNTQGNFFKHSVTKEPQYYKLISIGDLLGYSDSKIFKEYKEKSLAKKEVEENKYFQKEADKKAAMTVEERVNYEIQKELKAETYHSSSKKLAGY